MIDLSEGVPSGILKESKKLKIKIDAMGVTWEGVELSVVHASYYIILVKCTNRKIFKFQKW